MPSSSAKQDDDLGDKKASLDAKEPTQTDYIIAGVAYSTCAATLLVINKAAVDLTPSPAVVVASQLGFAALIARLLIGSDTVDGEVLVWDKVKAFIWVSLLFTLCLVCNVKALAATSVETVIVMRSCSPIFVALFDWKFLGTGAPLPATWGCLFGIAVGAYVYVHFDKGMEVDTYLWPVVYFVSICAEMVFVKHIINTVKMTTWTRVYYNNVLGFLPTIAFGFMFNEYEGLSETVPEAYSFEWWNRVVILVVSCCIGLAISFAGFHARTLLSATSFTVLGVANKVISIFLSLFFFGGMANGIKWESLAGLFMCIGFGTAYAKTLPNK